MTTIKNLCIPEKYEKNGETKTAWNKVGVLVETDKSTFIKLYHMPGVTIGVFDQKKRDEEAF